MKARRAGLSADDVERQLTAALYGQVAFILPEEDRLTKVRVRYADRLRQDRHALSNLPLTTPSGDVIPLLPGHSFTYHSFPVL